MDWDGVLNGLGVVFLLIVFGLFTAVVFAYGNPYLDQGLKDLYGEEPELNGSGRIVFEESDLKEFSEVYRDVETEFGWCLSVRGSSVEEVDYLTELRSATEENISFACTEGVHNGAVHTHPSVLGTVELSGQDKKSLLSNSWMSVSCVVGDVVERGVELNPRGLACYRDVGGKVSRLEVEVRQ